MKNLILIAICLMILGCTSNKINNGDIKREGILTKIQMSTWMYGTHVLSDEIGEPLTALSSPKINLDKYEGERVEVKGILEDGYSELGPEYLKVQSIKVINN